MSLMRSSESAPSTAATLMECVGKSRSIRPAQPDVRASDSRDHNSDKALQTTHF